MSHKFVIGVDGGGTHCRISLQDVNGNILGTAKAGPSNIMSDAQLAMSSIITACEEAIQQAKLTISLRDVAVCAGVAGANVPDAKARFLSLAHPFGQLTVISDLHAACLGAHGGDDGALIICGTGSAGTAYMSGHFTDLGGYGFSVGDNASAAWLGKESVKHVLLAFDGIQEKGTLFKRLTDFLQVKSPLELVHEVSTFTPDTFGKLAPLVIESADNGCSVAHNLLSEGANYLSSLAKSLLSGVNEALPLCFVGGMTSAYLPFMQDKFKARLVSPKYDAQHGAIFHLNQVR